MWPFRHRVGKHALGAAVSAIPSAVWVVEPLPVYTPVPVRPPVAAPPAPAGPRVELGFRDGSTAALLPGSPQAKALEEIAAVLTQRE